MKLITFNIFTFLLWMIMFTSISYGQSSKEVRSNEVNSNIKSIEVAPKTNTDNPTKTAVAPSNWHSENSVDGVVTISKKKNEPQVIHNKEYFENEIVRIDNHINAISEKIDYVNSDQTSKSEAETSGWFDDMERIKSELEAQKLEIQSTLIKLENK